MQSTELKVGNIVYVNFLNGHKDVCVVKKLDKGVAVLKSLDNAGKEEINISSDEQWKMVEGIPFKQDFLNQMGFVDDSSYRVYGLPDEGAYVKFIGSLKGPNDIIVKKEEGSFVLVVRKDEAEFGCKFIPIPYLHVFQNNVSSNIDYSSIKFKCL